MALDRKTKKVFAQPWHAQAFAMAFKLQEQGLFTRDEWTEAFGEEIARAPGSKDPCNSSASTEETYYLQWLTTLERLIITKGLLTEAELGERKSAWDRAARSTPHGQPIELDPAT